jgi:hypothetical protein
MSIVKFGPWRHKRFINPFGPWRHKCYIDPFGPWRHKCFINPFGSWRHKYYKRATPLGSIFHNILTPEGSHVYSQIWSLAAQMLY